MDIRGHVVSSVWIEKASEIEREYYLSVTFDRGEKKPLFMFTTKGGVDIEEVAESDPGALARLHIDPLVGFQPFQARWLVFTAGLEDPDEQKQVLAIVGKLYDAFVGTDAMLCEINPLILTPAGEVKALDRMTIDLPIVVRLDGTNAAEGRAMLADAAPPNLYVEETMLSAAERVVELAKERR
jgi:succinyl-CoA synthetase beta subunit